MWRTYIIKLKNVNVNRFLTACSRSTQIPLNVALPRLVTSRLWHTICCGSSDWVLSWITSPLSISFCRESLHTALTSAPRAVCWHCAKDLLTNLKTSSVVVVICLIDKSQTKLPLVIYYCTSNMVKSHQNNTSHDLS